MKSQVYGLEARQPAAARPYQWQAKLEPEPGRGYGPSCDPPVAWKPHWRQPGCAAACQLAAV